MDATGSYLVLSPREQQVYAFLLTGASEKQIAAALRLSQSTVHAHVRAIYRAIDVQSRAELMAKEIERLKLTQCQ